jgi:hypothetical protein
MSQRIKPQEMDTLKELFDGQNEQNTIREIHPKAFDWRAKRIKPQEIDNLKELFDGQDGQKQEVGKSRRGAKESISAQTKGRKECVSEMWFVRQIDNEE